MKSFYCIYQSEIGEIRIFYNEKGEVRAVNLPYDKYSEIEAEYRDNEDIREYMDSYFSGKETNSLQLDIEVTDFQRKVFNALMLTNRGTYLTYGDMARLIGCHSPRAIGQALKRNPCPIIIPCHRVVGKGWDGGFGGETDGPKMNIKKYLLKIEQGIKETSNK